MKTSNLIILLVLTAALGAAWFLYNNNNTKKIETKFVSGTKLFPELLVNDICYITLTDSNRTLTLEKTSGIWRVKEHKNYFANFDRILKLLKDLNDAVVGQVVNLEPESFYKLDLAMPSSSQGPGALYELKLSNNETVAKIIVGKLKRSNVSNDESPMSMYNYSMPDGCYVNLVGTDKALLTKTIIDVNSDPSYWIQREVINVPENTIKKIEIINEAEPAVKLLRTDVSDTLSLEFVPEEQQMNKNKVREVTSVISRLNAKEIFSNDETSDMFDNNSVVKVKYTTFEDLVYNLSAVETTNQTILIRINLDTDSIVTNEVVSELKVLELKDRAKNLNERLNDWTFEVFGDIEKFSANPDVFLEEKEIPEVEYEMEEENLDFEQIEEVIPEFEDEILEIDEESEQESVDS